jgi:hypothetical protein
MDKSPKRLLVRGGPSARAHVEKVLDLRGKRRGAVPPCGISEIKAFDDDSIRLVISREPLSPLVIILGPASGGGKPNLTTSKLSIRYEGTRLDPDQEKLLRFLWSRLEKLSHADLLAMMEKDPEALIPDDLPDSAGAPAKEKKSHHQSARTVEPWGADHMWRTFIFRKEIARNFGCSIRMRQPAYSVIHGDLECRFATPRIDGRAISFINYPWIRPLQPLRGAGETLEARMAWEERFLTTDLRESDVVGSGMAKLEKLLGSIQPDSGESDPVVIKVTCLPHLIGDDLEAAARSWSG